MNKVWKWVAISGVIAIILLVIIMIGANTTKSFESEEYGFSIEYNDKFYKTKNEDFELQLKSYENSIEISASVVKKEKTTLTSEEIIDNYIATLGVFYDGYKIEEKERKERSISGNQAYEITTLLTKGKNTTELITILLSLQDRELVFYISGNQNDMQSKSLLIDNIIKSIKIL